MKTALYRKMPAGLPGLNAEQLDELAIAAESRRQSTEALQTVETAHAGSGCAHCGDTWVVKNGHCQKLPCVGSREGVVQGGHRA